MDIKLMPIQPSKIKQEEQIESEEDPIIDELPVYLSKQLAKQLHVLQFPMRMNDGKSLPLRKFFFKPINKEVKIELRINQRSRHFDGIRAEQLAHVMNSADEKRKMFASDVFDTIVYNSSQHLRDASSYAIAACNGNAIYLTPLGGFFKLRPSLEFIDKYLNRDKDDADIADPESRPLQSVTVKCTRPDIDNNVRPKHSTYQEFKERSDSERWMKCKWYPSTDAASRRVKDKLFLDQCEDLHDDMSISQLTNVEYMKRLVPQSEDKEVVHPSLPSHVVSLHVLRSQPVLEQCRVLLKDTKMIQLQQMILFLAPGNTISQESVIKCLPQIAVLVRGNWVVKSNILYPKNSHSAVSGVSADQMCNARDYVLYLFTKQEFIERRKVGQMIRLPAEEVKEILTGISKLKHNKGWEMLLPEDREFISKHGDIVERQRRLWERRWTQLNDFYKGAPKAERTRKRSRCDSKI